LLVQIFAVFVMLAILSVLIIVHECGHFFVARFFGFQTPVFGFGLPFGPSWTVGKKWGTEFRIHACLLGGYVAIPELGDESNAQPDAFGVPLAPFKKFPIWQRALVAFAGVGMNMIFAYLVTLFMFFNLGQPATKASVSFLPPNNTIAANAGIKPGDEIEAIDGHSVFGSDDCVTYLGEHKHTKVTLTVLRDKQPLDLTMTTNENGKVGMGLIEKPPLVYKKMNGGFFDTCGQSFNWLAKMTKMMVDGLGQMFQGIFSGGKASAPGGSPKVGLQDLHGVLAVIKIGADIAQKDWSQLFMFTIMISMDLALVNLVPWPALDGGHLAFMTFEAVRGRPMGERAQGEIVKWGFAGLMVLMVFIMFNDITAMMSGKLDSKKPQAEEKESKDKDSKDAKTSAPPEEQAPPR
jgi:regulator of sigma E protease